MRRRPVLFDTSPRAGVATRAVIEVKDEDALAFVETLFDVIIQDAMADSRAVKSRHRLLDNSPAQDTRLAQHLEKIGAAELGQFQLIQSRTGGAADPGRKDRSKIFATQIQLIFQ